MPIIIHLDRVMRDRRMSLNELSAKVGITLSNLSIIKNQKAKALRLDTLASICHALHCQPADLMVYVPEEGIEPTKSDNPLESL
ncbi:XRE family transcriptional regulator [Sphingobacterium sp. ML3W]|nr:XRE family transcriptional regulator [Sphingobacterium sp. ML3W]